MINFTKVTKKYGDGTIAIDKVDFKINEGEFIFLVGPTGAGKTTIFKLLTLEVKPTGGGIEVDGENLAKIKKKNIWKLRRKIGRVFQDLKLLSDRTIYENVSLVLEVFGEKKNDIASKTEKVLKMLGIFKLKDKFPAQVSGGEFQRAAIARAVVGKPKYLLCDEPTADLDPETTWEILDLLNEINKKGTTVILATHDVDIVNSMKKRVLRVVKGKIKKDDLKGKYE